MTTQTNNITIKGSAQIITKYLHYGINSILFQRGIYPPEEFAYKEEYGITTMVSKNKKVLAFLDAILEKLEEWLPQKKIDRVSLVFFALGTKKPLERWDFSLSCEDDHRADENSEPVSNKSLNQIKAEIRNVMRQITSSISFLPLIENGATFDIMLHPKMTEYTKDIPSEFEWTLANDITIPDCQTNYRRVMRNDIQNNYCKQPAAIILLQVVLEPGSLRSGSHRLDSPRNSVNHCGMNVFL